MALDGEKFGPRHELRPHEEMAKGRKGEREKKESEREREKNAASLGDANSGHVSFYFLNHRHGQYDKAKTNNEECKENTRARERVCLIIPSSSL